MRKNDYAILFKYDFQVPVQLREVSDFESIIQSCPFNKLDLEDATKVMVTLGSEIYFYCPNGYGKTKLNNSFVEKKLKVSATTRNWKSVMRICILAMGNKVR